MRPNILLITAHDLGRHLGCYGIETVCTPNLDRLVGRGVLFEQNFCAAPQCSPGRAALHTGRYPHANGVLGQAHAPFNFELHPDEIHLAQHLQTAGYATALIGVQGVVQDPRRVGFERVLPRGTAIETGNRVKGLLDELQTEAQPFYLEVGFFEPHRPYDFGNVSPDTHRGVTVPPYVPDIPAAHADFAALQGAIQRLDEGIGLILDALDRRGLWEQTWVIFTTDHGLAMPRAKCTLYDPGIETALLMHWTEGNLRGGRRIAPLVSHVDLAPTILDALELPLPANLHGRSFWNLLHGRPYVPRQEIFAEKSFHLVYEPMRCLRTATHKLILNLEPATTVVPPDVQKSPIYPHVLDRLLAKHPPFELYDLGADPGETKNLGGSEETSAIERDLRRRLLDWMQETGDPVLEGPIPSHFYQVALADLRAD